jgi:hypothetical protein
MSWFGQKDAPEKPSENVDLNATEREAARAEVEALRQAEEAKAMAALPGLYEEAKAAHAQDVAAYSFECRRWGDYLTVFVSRLGVRGWRHGEGWSHDIEANSYSTSINVRDSRTITLANGRAPDLNGRLGYHVRAEKDGDEASWCSSGGSGEYKAPKGYHWAVHPNLPSLTLRGEMFRLDERKSDNLSHYNSVYFHNDAGRGLSETPGYLRLAEDDRIYFSGVGATIFAPAGKGQEVHDAIMREIARGSE